MTWHDFANLMLLPFHVALRPSVGLVLKGSIDEVRKSAGLAALLPINGVEVIGYGEPINPSCNFLGSMHTLRYLRLFAGPLTEIESIESIANLRGLSIEHVRKIQSIPLTFVRFPMLESVLLEWFQGAENVFNASSLRCVFLMNFPLARSDCFASLPSLTRVRLTSCEFAEIVSLGEARNLVWVALHDLEKLEDFSSLSGQSTIRFLWIERCYRLRSLEFLRGMEALETLRILDCGQIAGIDAVRALPKLRHIHIHGSVEVLSSDMSFLRDLPMLENVVIKGLPSSEAQYWRRRNRLYNLLRTDLRV